MPEEWKTQGISLLLIGQFALMHITERSVLSRAIIF